MLEFRVLGPLEVLSEGTPIEIGKGRERALLALLVVSGRPVPPDEIVAALWRGRPPSTAAEMVRNAVARLRARLGQGVIETTAAGYRLVAGEGEIDARCFERLAASGGEALRQGDAARAAEALRRALALWRGRPAPELDDDGSSAPLLRALEELRLRVEEDRLDAELVLGRAPALVHELEALHQQHPYRERLLGQLMHALYLSGRQKDALDRYAAGRRRLVDEVGLEPGPALQELQHRILQHDLGLRPAVPDVSPALPSPTGRRILTHGGLAAVAAVVVVVAAAFAAAWPRHAAPAIPTRGVVALGNDGRADIAARVWVPQSLVAVDGDHVWLASQVAHTVVEMKAGDVSPVRFARIPNSAFSLVAAGGSAWVGDGFAGTVSRIGPTGHTGTFRPSAGARGRLPLAVSGGRVWVASQDGSLTDVDAATGRPIRTFRDVGYAEAIAADTRDVWVAAATADVVERFDVPSGRVVQRIPVGGRATALAISAGAVWALTPAESSVWRIDPHRGSVVESVSVPADSSALAATDGQVWVAAGGGLLTSISTSNNSVDQTRSLGRSIDALAGAGDRLWVTVG